LVKRSRQEVGAKHAHLAWKPGAGHYAVRQSRDGYSVGKGFVHWCQRVGVVQDMSELSSAVEVRDLIAVLRANI
jgi:hypothetical protein